MKIDNVIKRDGRKVSFERNRIVNAIFAACRACQEPNAQRLSEVLAGKVIASLEKRWKEKETEPRVEEIQDIVEEVLVKHGDARIAKAYILYREKRSGVRSGKQILLDGEKLVDDYLKMSDWRVRENSNMNYSLQGLNFYLASSIAARYWLQRIYSPEVQQAHADGDIHIHDLGMLSVYCCGWDLQDILLRGFGGVSSKVESRPARHLRTALGQLSNFFYTLQGECAGAVAVSNFDTLLAPFVRSDKLDYPAVHQALQEFIFNLNVPTRVGFQTPFTNITFDLTPPRYLAEQPVIIGGEPQDMVYGDFQSEMDLINQAFAAVMLDGDAHGRVFTFPIPTYNLTVDFDWENPVMENIWRMTARYGSPYFANFINSDMKPEDARSMCCRLRLDNRQLRKRLGGLFASVPLTGSVGVVTINLPRLGCLAKSEEEFLSLLTERLELARTSLEIKRKTLENLTQQGLYPFSSHYLESVLGQTGNYWGNHFSTIGIIGMHEACLNLFGVGIDHAIGMGFSQRTLDFLLGIIERFQSETGNLYNLEATPAESVSYRLARLDSGNFSSAHTSGTLESPYYTNSTQLPVGFNDDLFVILNHQDQLQPRYTGGTVQHIFLGEQLADWRQARLLVRRVAESFTLPYFTLTPTFSVCPIHGYLAGNHLKCPQVHAPEVEKRYPQGVPCEVYSRIVGYLRPAQDWNQGKQQEFLDRHTFDANTIMQTVAV